MITVRKLFNPSKRKSKICLTCSAGGHLTEILQLKECYKRCHHLFITFKREDTTELSKKEKMYFVDDPKRNLLSVFKCIFQTFKIIIKEKPNVIISTGAGVALPSCYISKLFFKSKIIFVESFCRTEEPSLSGKLVYPIADLFFVQWRRLLDKYGKKAIYRGAVI